MVIKQRPGFRFFVAAPNSFIIDKAGFLQLIKGAKNIGIISKEDLKEIYENTENSSSSGIG